jgi:hypothetical protein
MSGTIPLLPLYAFVSWTGKLYLLLPAKWWGEGTKLKIGILIKSKFVILADFLFCPGKIAVMYGLPDASLTRRSRRLYLFKFCT